MLGCHYIVNNTYKNRFTLERQYQLSLHTIKMYLKEDVVHVEIVLLVALIGISRHVIDLDFKHIEPLTIFGIAALIIALSVGYFLIK